jgi:hypothetical protein
MKLFPPRPDRRHSRCREPSESNSFPSPRGAVGVGAPPGRAEPWSWKPYKLWVGDLWRCPTCHYQTITGVPAHPIAEHYQPGFDELVERLGARRLLVKDC